MDIKKMVLTAVTEHHGIDLKILADEKLLLNRENISSALLELEKEGFIIEFKEKWYIPLDLIQVMIKENDRLLKELDILEKQNNILNDKIICNLKLERRE